MKKHLAVAALAALLWACPAFAIVAKPAVKANDAPAFACTPNGFGLTMEQDSLRLQGALTVPTTGYTYTVDEEEPGPDGSMYATVHVQAPSGAAGQVISQLAIDYTFKSKGGKLSVAIDGPGKLAGGKIECKLAESAP